MKLAVILFGHYRTFDKHVEYWRSIEADFYISTWDTIDSTSKSWYKPEYRGIPLTANQIQTLKSFDPNCFIGTQEWNANEMEDMYGNLPFKSILYKYESILKSVRRIQDSKIEYDTILVTRPDIQINNIGTLNPVPGEIFMSYLDSPKFLRGHAACGLVYAVNYSDIEKISTIPENLFEWKANPKKYNYEEDHFTDFIHQKWDTIRKTYEYNTDFVIIRLSRDNQQPNTTELPLRLKFNSSWNRFLYKPRLN